MKFLFTCLTLLLSLSAYCQIQLDSVIQINTEYQEESTQYNFTYKDGDLVGFELEFEDELFATITINYNEAGQMDYLSEDNFGTLSNIFSISYNSDAKIDTVFYEVVGVQKNVGVYEYLDDKRSKLTVYVEVEDGELAEFYRREYSYTDNTTAVELYSVLTGGGIASLITSEFDDEGRIIKWSEDGGNSLLTDSLVYMDGCMQSVLRYNPNTEDYQEILTYVCDETLDYSSIANPVELLLFISDYYGDPLMNIFWPILYSNQILSSEGSFGFEESTTEWFYSTATSANERVEAIPFSVYPNPTSDLIRLELEENLVQYSIYNISGQVVRSEAMEVDQLISVKSLIAGSYTIVANTKDEAYYFAQFIKQ